MNEKISDLYDKIDFLNNIINTQIIENNKLKEKIDNAIEFCDRYLQLDLELFDSYGLLKKVKEILGEKENEN